MANRSSTVVKNAAPPNAGKGRKKGVPNKTTVVMKEAIMQVYADLQADTGKQHGHFKSWAEKNPTEFYKIAAKLIPISIGGGDDGAPIAITLVRQADAG